MATLLLLKEWLNAEKQFEVISRVDGKIFAVRRLKDNVEFKILSLVSLWNNKKLESTCILEFLEDEIHVIINNSNAQITINEIFDFGEKKDVDFINDWFYKCSIL